MAPSIPTTTLQKSQNRLSNYPTIPFYNQLANILGPRFLSTICEATNPISRTTWNIEARFGCKTTPNRRPHLTLRIRSRKSHAKPYSTLHSYHRIPPCQLHRETKGTSVRTVHSAPPNRLCNGEQDIFGDGIVEAVLDVPDSFEGKKGIFLR